MMLVTSIGDRLADSILNFGENDMRRFFRRGAATAALLALVCGGVAVTPAIATEIEDTPVTALEDGAGQPDESL